MFEDRWQCHAEQIRLDHAQIARLVRSVRRTCQEESLSQQRQFAAAKLKACLIQLQRVLEQLLDQHQCGYIEDAVSFAPRFGREAEALRRQRAALVRRVGRIAGEVHQMRGNVENRLLLAAEITDLLDEIEANENAEARLVEAALNVDLDLHCGDCECL